MDSLNKTIRSLQRLLVLLAGLLTATLVAILVLVSMRLGLIRLSPISKETRTAKGTDKPLWQAPNESVLASAKNAEQIRYGRALIANTAAFWGPKGKIAFTSNGMNCQNCHLDAGTKPWGNNYGAVAATYPKFRERSGTVETIEKRINDCFERSLNGKILDTGSREMKSMVAYIKFLGHTVPKGESPPGSGIWKLAYLDRSANPFNGQMAYSQQCSPCHGNDGQGVLKSNGSGYSFPPLWGTHSFNQGAGLFRISRLAGYIKTNMPLGATFNNPILSDEEAWDIAAFIESKPRPKKDLSRDWPNIRGKPIDHPFGPYVDSFSEFQHKYGPFKPIEKWQEDHQANIN